jgi:hypothetical protein
MSHRSVTGPKPVMYAQAMFPDGVRNGTTALCDPWAAVAPIAHRIKPASAIAARTAPIMQEARRSARNRLHGAQEASIEAAPEGAVPRAPQQEEEGGHA